MILRRDPICTVPGCIESSTDADHIVPKRDGGLDTLENLQGLCRGHHSQKTRREGRARPISTGRETDDRTASHTNKCAQLRLGVKW